MADIYNLADTWNEGATTFTGIKLDVTDTASAAGSKLLDLLVGGVSKASIGKGGNLALALEANLSAIAVTGASLTGANAQSFVDIAGTWNTTGTPSAIKLNVTDTASAAASLLMDLQVGAVSRFSVSKAGLVTMAGGATLAANQVLNLSGGGYVGTTKGRLGNIGGLDGLALPPDSRMVWTAGGETGVQDTVLTRSAAGIMALAGNGTGGALQLTEMTAPAAGAANTGRLFLQDNGAGKTQLMVIFATGAAQQVAIEP